jgi:hypothetical protein
MHHGIYGNLRRRRNFCGNFASIQVRGIDLRTIQEANLGRVIEIAITNCRCEADMYDFCIDAFRSPQKSKSGKRNKSKIIPEAPTLQATAHPIVLVSDQDKKTSTLAVYNRIRHDAENFHEDEFAIGYLDRFTGTQEVPFSEFVTIRDDVVEGIPRHRIEYFKHIPTGKMFTRRSKFSEIAEWLATNSQHT